MLKSRSKLHTHDDGKRDRERDGVRCSVLVGDDIPHPLIVARQNTATVTDPVLDDEQLEES